MALANNHLMTRRPLLFLVLAATVLANPGCSSPQRKSATKNERVVWQTGSHIPRRITATNSPSPSRTEKPGKPKKKRAPAEEIITRGGFR